jgi:hypothetical protein
MPRFRKKPVEIEARRYTGDNPVEMLQWILSCGREASVTCNNDGCRFEIETLEGSLEASPGDWIIRGVLGEFYPCKPDAFEATYDPITETPE